MPAASADSTTRMTARVVRSHGSNAVSGTAAIATPPALSAREVLSQVRYVRSLASVNRGSGSMEARYFAPILPRESGLTWVVRTRRDALSPSTTKALKAGRRVLVSGPSSSTARSRLPGESDRLRRSAAGAGLGDALDVGDRKSTRLNSSHVKISY